jgi:hypothetical protein
MEDLDDLEDLGYSENAPQQQNVVFPTKKLPTPVPVEKPPNVANTLVQTKSIIPVSWHKPLYITAAVFGGLFVIGIIIAVVLLTRSKNSPTQPVSPSGSVTPADDRHHPINLEIATVKEGTVSMDFLGGLTLEKVQMIPGTENVGIILFSTGLRPQFVTVSSTADSLNLFKQTTLFTNATMPVNVFNSSSTSVSSIWSCGAVDITTGNITLAEVDVESGTVKNTRVSTNSVVSASTRHTWITSGDEFTSSDSNLALSCQLVPATQGPDAGQVFDLTVVRTDGQAYPLVAFDIGLSMVGDYKSIVTSSNNPYLAFVFLDTRQSRIVDYLYTTQSHSSVVTDLPVEVKGSAVTCVSTGDTSKLFVLFQTALYVYQRTMSDTRPTFKLMDYFYGPAKYGNFHHCSVDSLGEWFCIATTNKTTLVGKFNISSGLIDYSSLKTISSLTGDLKNTNGPCAISRVGSNKDDVVVFQSDTIVSGALYRFPNTTN